MLTGNVRLPELIIPGAQKSATTTLYHWLAEHPDCAMATPKEPMFFTRTEGQTPEHYAHFFDSEQLSHNPRVIGEASTTYLSIPRAASGIAQMLGLQTQFIVLLRNPVERAISAYWHMAKRFHETRSLQRVFDFQGVRPSAVIDEEEHRIARAAAARQIPSEEYQQSLGDGHWPWRYLRNSVYLNDLQRYERIFGRERMLILLTDELRDEPVCTFRKVADFLGIDGNHIPQSVGRSHNVTTVPPQTSLVRNTARIVKSMPVVGARLSGRLVRTVGSAPRPVPPDVQQYLNEFFRPHVQALADYLQRDLTCWSDDPSRGFAPAPLRSAS